MHNIRDKVDPSDYWLNLKKFYDGEQEVLPNI